MMEEAADAYERAGQLYEQSKSNHETARAYVEAAKCRKTVSPVSAIDAYGKVSFVLIVSPGVASRKCLTNPSLTLTLAASR